MSTRVSRILTIICVLGLALTGCQPEIVEVVKEVPVDKIVEVEKVVKVEVEKVVEKIVEVTAVPEAHGPLKVVLSADPRSLDPTIDTIKTSLVIIFTMVEPLVKNQPDGSYAPWLAESWELIDPNRWRLHLKEGVQFHNGEAFNADTVAFSVDTFINTPGEARGWFSFLKGSEVVDEYTIDLITNNPTVSLPPTLAFLFAFPPEYYAEVGSEGFGENPVGTGPYQFKEWNRGVDLKVEVNPDYWGVMPTVEEIQFLWAAEASSRMAMLETGEAHITQKTPPQFISQIENNPDIRIETARSIRKVFLRLNPNEPPTDNPKVRQALNYAINVESIILNLFQGHAYGRDTGFILPGMECYDPDRLSRYTYDPEKAKQLLAEAGYPDGFEMDFWHTLNDQPLDKETSEAIAADLAKVGITVNLIGRESGAFYSKVGTERVSGAIYSASGPLFMTPLYHPLIEFQANMPYGHSADDRTDELTQLALQEFDSEKKCQILYDLEDYVMYEAATWVWLYHFEDVYGVSNQINWKARSDELLSFETASWAN